MSGRVLVIGSINIDLVADVEHIVRPGETIVATDQALWAGGKGANQAVAAHLAGATVSLVGAVGDDGPGYAYLARLRDLGVDVRGVRVHPDLPTGQAFVCVDPEGQNSIVVIPGANLAVHHDERARAALALLEPGDVVLLQLEVDLGVIEAVVREASELDLQVILNAAPYAAVAPDVLDLVDVVIVNEQEALLLADSAAVPRSIVMTLGAAGACWDGGRVSGPVVDPADVVDTTGAGDAFCGTLAAWLARGYDREEALQAALRAGAEAVRRRGAQPHGTLRTTTA